MAHNDGEAITMGGKAYAKRDVLLALATQLETLPVLLRQPRRFPLGTYRGLELGLILDPEFPADVYLQGAITRKIHLSREHQGPRAILNTLDRLADGSQKERDQLRQELDVAQNQLQDYQSPFGSVDAGPLSATSIAANELPHNAESGCSPGCRNDRHSASLPDISRHEQDSQLLQLVRAWPRLSPHVRAAIVTLANAALSVPIASSVIPDQMNCAGPGTLEL